MKEYARHKVKVWLEEDTAPEESNSPSRLRSLVPQGTFSSEWDIEHTEECDNLKYGQECALDWMLECDTEGMPTEPGNYLVWVVDESQYVNNWSHCGWEPAYYIDYEKVSDE